MPTKPRRGRPPLPKGEKAEHTQIRIPKDAEKPLRELAKSLGVSMAQAAGMAIAEAHGRRAKA